MIKHKQLLAFFATTAIAISMFTACAAPKPIDVAVSPETTSTQTATEPEKNTDEAAQVYKIGILQIAEHEALDEARRGFEEEIKALGINCEIDYQNAQGEIANLKTMSQRFVANKVDLVVSVATPCAQTMSGESKEIPILGTAITDYVEAGLVKTNENPQTNVSGTSDATPIVQQMDLLVKLVPDVKTVGIIYASSESNSKVQVEQVKKELETRGIAVKIATIDNVNDLSQVAQGVAKDVQVIYVPTDNVVAGAISTLVAVTEPLKIPVIGAEENQVKNGATATIGINYYELGKLTAQMAKKVLVEKTPIQELPVQTLQNYDIVFNQKNLDKIGMMLDEQLKSQVKTFY